MKGIRYIGAVALLLVANTAYAAAYLCPATIAQVTAACGQPTTQVNTEREQPAKTKVFEWVYSRAKPAPRSMTVQVTNNVVTGITVNGKEVVYTSFCGSAVAIRNGTPTNSLITYCGQPGIVNQLKKKGPKIKQTQLIYKTRTYFPATIFIFQDGKLIEMRRSQ